MKGLFFPLRNLLGLFSLTLNRCIPYPGHWVDRETRSRPPQPDFLLCERDSDHFERYCGEKDLIYTRPKAVAPVLLVGNIRGAPSAASVSSTRRETAAVTAPMVNIVQ